MLYYIVEERIQDVKFQKKKIAFLIPFVTSEAFCAVVMFTRQSPLFSCRVCSMGRNYIALLFQRSLLYSRVQSACPCPSSVQLSPVIHPPIHLSPLPTMCLTSLPTAFGKKPTVQGAMGTGKQGAGDRKATKETRLPQYGTKSSSFLPSLCHPHLRFPPLSRKRANEPRERSVVIIGTWLEKYLTNQAPNKKIDPTRTPFAKLTVYVLYLDPPAYRIGPKTCRLNGFRRRST
ncbi:unnamed protein product [Periconia digitata]|uniref:Uncharacterized protein n=1 Tax=Periconia digitata TaxID=1303443 RepID=A0A9W4UEY9_9PLEO|nr:unnamed protein product [Periconia digitata]